jgi:hypothetical protein
MSRSKRISHSRQNLVSWLTEKENIVFLFGHGTKNPYAQFPETFTNVQYVLKDKGLVPDNTRLVYFGDAANEKKPDIGWLAAQLVHVDNYELGMIQLKRAQKWGEPQFVTKTAIRWHGKTPEKETKEEQQLWGGVNADNKPIMNTQELHDICTALSSTSVKLYFFFVGGGPTAAAEYTFLQKQDYARDHLYYIPAEGVKGLGDIDAAVTSVTKSASTCLLC